MYKGTKKSKEKRCANITFSQNICAVYSRLSCTHTRYIHKARDENTMFAPWWTPKCKYYVALYKVDYVFIPGACICSKDIVKNVSRVNIIRYSFGFINITIGIVYLSYHRLFIVGSYSVVLQQSQLQAQKDQMYKSLVYCTTMKCQSSKVILRASKATAVAVISICQAIQFPEYISRSTPSGLCESASYIIYLLTIWALYVQINNTIVKFMCIRMSHRYKARYYIIALYVQHSRTLCSC